MSAVQARDVTFRYRIGPSPVNADESPTPDGTVAAGSVAADGIVIPTDGGRPDATGARPHAGARADRPALDGVSLDVGDGEFVVLCGQSGCGKTTFTRLLNGLVPTFHAGDLTGACTVCGLECGHATVEQYAALVGSVFQNPKTQYFNAFVADELAFPCENAGWEPERIRERVAEVADRFGVAHLLDRSIFGLSGGEKQRIAVASACMLRPRLLVLDEPTSNLDRRAMRDLAALLAGIKRTGVTIVVAEHRLAWCADLADRYVLFESGRVTGDHDAARFAAIPEARREAMGLRTLDVAPFVRRVDDLAARWPRRADDGPRIDDSSTIGRASADALDTADALDADGRHAGACRSVTPRSDGRRSDVIRSDAAVHSDANRTGTIRSAHCSDGRPLLSTRGLVVGHRGGAGHRPFRKRASTRDGFSRAIPDLDLFAGEIVGVMGHNGIGKSTLVRTLVGLAAPLSGTVLWHGGPARPRTLTRGGFLVMQDVNYQLFADSVRGELTLGLGENDADGPAARRTCDAVLGELDLTELADRHPMSLSGGQKQRTAIASALMCGKELIVLDEPTSGLDRRHMVQVGALLRRLADRGKAVVVVTHDEELAAEWCDRILDLDRFADATTNPAND